MTKQRLTFTRRSVIMTGVAVMLAHPALAGGDGGGGGNSGSYTAPRKPPATKSKYTQDEFARLSAAEIAELEYKFELGKRLTIIGFSVNMSDYLILMANFRRRRTQRLIRDMQKLKDKAKRVARLNREKLRVEKEMKDLENARKRAVDKGYKRVAEETLQQINKSKKYIMGLKVWIAHPDEGNR